MAILLAPTKNFLSTTLNGAINNSTTTITLTSTANLQAPGVIVVDRIDSNGSSTASLREVIHFTGISGSDLTGCTRGAENSTANSHADGAIVETNPTVETWNSMATAIFQFADSNGYINAINSPVSIAIGEFKTVRVSSLASVSMLCVMTFLDVSGASISGIGLYPSFRSQGFFSGPTTGLGGILVHPRATNYQFFSVITPQVASGVSIVFDFLKNGSSIFAGVTKPTIVGGGTYVSTASINTKNFDRGDILRFDISAMAPGAIQGITGQGGS